MLIITKLEVAAPRVLALTKKKQEEKHVDVSRVHGR